MKRGIKKIISTALTILLVGMNICNISALEPAEKEEKIKQEKLEGVQQKESKGNTELKDTKQKPAEIKKSEKCDMDIYDPSNYPLVSTGYKIDTIYDSYYTTHNLYYEGISDYNGYYMRLRLRDITDYAYSKDEMIYVEVYTDEGGHLDYEGTADFDTWGYTNFSMGVLLEYHKYEDQKYIYLRVGPYDEYYDYFTAQTFLKVKNPFYKDYAGHWAESAIEDFMERGIIANTNQFRPNDSITRAEFVKILNGTFGLTKSSGKVFTDTKNHWARYAIDVAVTNGVCNGKTATHFKPDDPITREEASVMIASYKKVTDRHYDKLSKYKDAYKVASWAKPGVEGTIEKGYMSGYSDNTFRPKNKITRAEAVATFSRIK